MTTVSKSERRLRELSHLWTRSNAITEHFGKEIRAAIVEAAYSGLTPVQISKATKISKGWVEECIVDECTGARIC